MWPAGQLFLLWTFHSQSGCTIQKEVLSSATLDCTVPFYLLLSHRQWSRTNVLMGKAANAARLSASSLSKAPWNRYTMTLFSTCVPVPLKWGRELRTHVNSVSSGPSRRDTNGVVSSVLFQDWWETVCVCASCGLSILGTQGAVLYQIMQLVHLAPYDLLWLAAQCALHLWVFTATVCAPELPA